MKRSGVLCIAALGAISVCGQSGLTGPNSGFLFDAPSKTVRLMQGALGATTWSDPVLDRIDFASISPAGNRAIACRRAECFAIRDLTSAEPATFPLHSTPEGVAWAADGASAVLYSRTGGWLQTARGFAGEPELGQLWNVPVAGPLLAVAYDGRHTVFSTGGNTGGIFEITASSGLLPLSDLQSAIALALASKTETLYALDGASPAVLRAPLKGGPADRWEVPLSDPVGLQVGAGALYVSGGTDQALLALDPQTGAIQERTDLPFRPSVLEPLPGSSFLLTSRIGPDSVLWTFVPSRGTYFIPAPPPVNGDAPARGRRR